MRGAVPTVSTPGVFSPVDDEIVTLDVIQDEFDNDPEVGEALRHLVFALENGTIKQRAFDSLNERLFFLYLRSRNRAETRMQDEHEEGFV